MMISPMIPLWTVRGISPYLPPDWCRWRHNGTWERLLAYAQTHSDAVGELECIVSRSRPFAAVLCCGPQSVSVTVGL